MYDFMFAVKGSLTLNLGKYFPRGQFEICFLMWGVALNMSTNIEVLGIG